MIFAQKEGIDNAFRSKGRHCQCLYLYICTRFVKLLIDIQKKCFEAETKKYIAKKQQKNTNDTSITQLENCFLPFHYIEGTANFPYQILLVSFHLQHRNAVFFILREKQIMYIHQLRKKIHLPSWLIHKAKFAQVK